jgi:hypothetical protein
MKVDRAKLARRLGLPAGADESLIRARLKGLEVQPLRAASTAGSDRRQAAAVEHEAFMRQHFPTVANQLGYVTPYVGGFLMGSAGSADSAVSASSAPARAATVEDRAHDEVMARFFPTVGKGPFRSPRARITYYGA